MSQLPNAETSAELHSERAKTDYSQSAELLKSGIQLAFAANGGASIAILSCLTTIATSKSLTSALNVSAILPKFTIAVAIYGLGVLLVAIALWAFSTSKENWGHFWEDNALECKPMAEVSFADNPFAISAGRYAFVGRWLFLLSAVAFIAGSGMAVSAFLL